MAAITAAVVVGATAAYSANRQGAAAKKAGRAQASAAQQTIDEQSRLYNESLDRAQPYAQAGTNALDQLNQINAGNYSAFENSPDYLYARDIGIQGLDRGAAARGSLYSGGADADRIAFSSGLATQNLGNYTNRLQNMVSLGSNTQQYLGQLGQNYGNQFGNAMGIKGNANAQVAAAGPMTQAGYGNAIASGITTYMGAGGGGGGGGGFMGMFGGGGGGNTTGYEQGSLYNFGNNMNNFRGWGG